MHTSQLVDHFFRTEYGKVVSHLTNKFGSKHLDLVEDSVQEALIKAMQTWPYSKIPQNPTGWILKVAQNKIIDQLRRNQKIDREAPIPVNEAIQDFELSDQTFGDDMIRMIFACCHPLLSHEYQIILTLKILGGLSVREIAGALVKKEETIAKSYTRAKKKFKKEEIALSLPPANEIESRLEMVLKIIYLLFNEGYKASEGPQLIREELCTEAIRLNTLLLGNELCQTPSSYALISLMHFQSARFKARIDQNGNAVSLEDQDRQKWDQDQILQGLAYLEKSTQDSTPNEYVIQAIINATHCQAASFEETNWNTILHLYDLHIQINDSPIIELNRVIPLQKVHGSMLALKEIERLETYQYFETYYLFYAIKAKILEEFGDFVQCKDAYKKALSLAKNEREKVFLLSKIDELS